MLVAFINIKSDYYYYYYFLLVVVKDIINSFEDISVIINYDIVIVNMEAYLSKNYE